MTPATNSANPNVPQQPMPFEQFAGPGPAPTNQTTTKPRQAPGDGAGSQPGMGGDVAMDPASNGSDVGEPEPPKDQGPPVQAARRDPYLMVDIMADVTEANPGLDQRMAYLLAKRVVDEFPLTKQAEGWNPLAFGNRAALPPMDLPLLRVKKDPVPKESPSRQQRTVQPEHARTLGPGTGGDVIEGEVIDHEPKGIEGPKPRKMTKGPDGQWGWDRPSEYDRPGNSPTAHTPFHEYPYGD